MKKIISTLALLVSFNTFALDRYQVDQIKVYKTKHLMHMFYQGKIVMSYKVMLGRGGMDPKRQQGDKLVPEGDYTLDYQNPNSKFYKSLHVSYPNALDIERAKKDGVDPGGDIMIHGMPNKNLVFENWMYELDNDVIEFLFNDSVTPLIDWTAGCIAVKNEMMEEIYQNVPVDTKISIYH